MRGGRACPRVAFRSDRTASDTARYRPPPLHKNTNTSTNNHQ